MTSCSTPLSDETLSALWSGDLTVADAQAAEEHLFSCDACEAQSRRLGRVVEGLSDVLPPVLSAANFARLNAEGKKLHVNPVQPGVHSSAYFAPDLDVLVHALQVDFAGAATVDLEVLVGTPEPLRFESVPFSRETGQVLIDCQRHFQDRYPREIGFRLLTKVGNERHVLGEYRVDHRWS